MSYAEDRLRVAATPSVRVTDDAADARVVVSGVEMIRRAALRWSTELGSQKLIPAPRI